MNRYYSKKDATVGICYLAVVLLVWSIILIPVFQVEKDVILYVVLTCICGLFTALILDVWTSTYYQIDNGKLRWHAGHLFHGSIDVASIRRISSDKTVLTVNGAYKPTLSFRRNITLRYNSYDELLIAPQDQARFIKELKKLNPDIQLEIS